MNPIEAAAKELERLGQQHRDFDQRFNWEAWARSVLSAAFVAQVACEQCGGTGLWETLAPEERHADSAHPCPREHAELPNPYGGTVHADPAKCEWRQQSSNRIKRHLAHVWSEEVSGPGHGKPGRWVPRPLEVTE